MKSNDHLFIKLLREQKPIFDSINTMDLSHIIESNLKYLMWTKRAVELEQFQFSDDLLFDKIMLKTPDYGFTASFYTKHVELYDKSELYFGSEDLEYKDGRSIKLNGKKKYYTMQFPDRKTRLKVVKKGADNCILYFLPMRIELPD